jgi:hypothetical protein
LPNGSFSGTWLESDLQSLMSARRRYLQDLVNAHAGSHIVGS